jgi:hypothetical protein
MKSPFPVFFIITSMLFLCSTKLRAQQGSSTSDVQLWTGLGLEKSLVNDKLNIGLSQEFRMDKNLSHLDIYFTEASFKFEIIDNVSLGYAYRYINKNKDSNGYQIRQRSNFDLSFKQKSKRLKLDYRLRFQSKTKKPEEYSDVAQTKYRFRVKGSYNIKKSKLNPYLGAEVFYIPEKHEQNGNEKLRFTAGATRKMKKLGKLNMYYRIEQELGSFSSPQPAFTSHILGLNFTFKL